MIEAASGRSAPTTGTLPFLPVTETLSRPGVFATALIETLVMPSAPTGVLLEEVHAVPSPFTSQPVLVVLSSAPGGTAVCVTPPSARAIDTRTPLATGSSGGSNGAGSVTSALIVVLSSPGGVSSPAIVTFAFLTGPPFVHA